MLTRMMLMMMLMSILTRDIVEIESSPSIGFLETERSARRADEANENSASNIIFFARGRTCLHFSVCASQSL